SVGSNAELSAGTSSSQDTIILPKKRTTERCQPLPKHFPIPQFAYETEMYLERATEDYKKNGTLLTASKVKADILEKLAETIYTYTAYPSSAQISDVAEALVNKYPCLKEPGSFSGSYGWQQSIRRHEIINLSPSVEDIKARWPALFEMPHIQDEFHRITMVHLESKFMPKLDEYTSGLMKLFHSKGRTMGLKLQAILLKDADEDTVSQDLAMQKIKIYSIRTGTSEDPDDVGIVIEGINVLTALGNFPRACSMLVGLIYVVNLAYPKELRYTFEVFQKVLLELDCSKLSPKVNSLKNKLLAQGNAPLQNE
ncbi:hypothetical protein D4764_12G0010940, partial [Takifugu flavidus]